MSKSSPTFHFQRGTSSLGGSGTNVGPLLETRKGPFGSVGGPGGRYKASRPFATLACSPVGPSTVTDKSSAGEPVPRKANAFGVRFRAVTRTAVGLVPTPCVTAREMIGAPDGVHV